LASGSDSRRIEMYNIEKGATKLLKSRQGFGWAVAFNQDEKLLATGNSDGTIIFYDVPNLDLQPDKTLPGNRPYEGTTITDVQGLTIAQQQTLIALGAKAKLLS